MAHVQIHRADLELDDPTLVEGLPGVGLVGKIATDHLVSSFDMVHYGSLHCDGLPEVAVYQDGERGVRAPVRLHADPDTGVVALTSDVPVSPSAADEFAGCATEWIDAEGARPVYLSGLPVDKDADVPSLYAITTGDGSGLESLDLPAPPQDGAVTGPTGALLYEAQRRGIDAVGLVVQADPQFPDPEAARVLLQDGIGPLAGVEVDTDRLVDQAEEIAEAKSQLAQQMQQGSDESTSARPLGMYQ